MICISVYPKFCNLTLIVIEQFTHLRKTVLLNKGHQVIFMQQEEKVIYINFLDSKEWIVLITNLLFFDDIFFALYTLFSCLLLFCAKITLNLLILKTFQSLCVFCFRICFCFDASFAIIHI